MKIIDIKRYLVKAVQLLERYDDEINLRLESNTYFVNEADAFLGVSGMDGGYLPLDERMLQKVIDNAEEDNWPQRPADLAKAFFEREIDERDVREWAKEKGWLNDPKIAQLIGPMKESTTFENIYKASLNEALGENEDFDFDPEDYPEQEDDDGFNFDDLDFELEDPTEEEIAYFHTSGHGGQAEVVYDYMERCGVPEDVQDEVFELAAEKIRDCDYDEDDDLSGREDEMFGDDYDEDYDPENDDLSGMEDKYR